MRGMAAGLVALGVAASLSACVDPNDALQRAVVGGALGATLGAGLGATFAINPPLGATIGAATGGVAGAVTGVITTQPPVTYGPIPPQDAAFGPEFYDTWPPGYSTLPAGAAAPPPTPHAS